MSRATILKAVRAAAAQRRPAPLMRQAVAPSGLKLAQSLLSGTLIARLRACGVIVERLRAWDAVPAAVLKVVTAAGQPLVIRHGADALFNTLAWNQVPNLQRRTGAASREDKTSLSRALSAISETGTLVLGSGPDNPVTLSFLPELHIVVLDETCIFETMDEALARVRSPGDAPQLPRTVNLISGASRTGDIGGRLVLGAHGPRQLAVLLVGGSQENGASEGRRQ